MAIEITWQTIIAGVLLAVIFLAPTTMVVWWFTFRTLGWPYNWRLSFDPFWYFRWVAATYWPRRHEPISLGFCVCGRWRCGQVGK